MTSAAESSFDARSTERRRIAANRRANRVIGFIGHFIIYVLGSLLLFVLAGFYVGLIVLIAWFIAIACHGFFGVVAPLLRERWVTSEVQRNTTEKDAERAVAETRHARTLAELSASIAHEIRNPITAAKSLVQQIAESPTAPENAEYATVAVTELDRVERAIAHLLRFAREEPRKVGRVRLGDTLDAALELLADRIRNSGVGIERDVASAGEVEGDSDQLRRVIVNLVGNAIDALVGGKTASPRIRIEAGENLSQTEAWIRIADNGPGIAADALPKIFTPFFTSKAEGTGLGLPLSRKIIEEHGGSLEAKSEPGSGAEFLVTLPIRGSAVSRKR